MRFYILSLIPFIANAFNFYGATKPLDYFDPLKFTEKASEIEKARLRECELKHGRWAMISCLSIPLIETHTQLPAIHEFDKLPGNIQLSIVGLIMMGEFQSMLRGWENPYTDNGKNVFKLRKDYQPGDMGFGRWQSFSDRKMELDSEKELNNGRLAMIGATGFMVQELVTNQPIF